MLRQRLTLHSHNNGIIICVQRSYQTGCNKFQHRDELDDDDALMQQRSYDEYEDVHSQMAATLMTLTPQVHAYSIPEAILSGSFLHPYMLRPLESATMSVTRGTL